MNSPGKVGNESELLGDVGRRRGRSDRHQGRLKSQIIGKNEAEQRNQNEKAGDIKKPIMAQVVFPGSGRVSSVVTFVRVVVVLAHVSKSTRRTAPTYHGVRISETK
jgi:hypothetical protein